MNKSKCLVSLIAVSLLCLQSLPAKGEELLNTVSRKNFSLSAATSYKVDFPDELDFTLSTLPSTDKLAVHLEHSKLAIFRSNEGSGPFVGSFVTFAFSRNRCEGAPSVCLRYYDADGKWLGNDTLLVIVLQYLGHGDDYTNGVKFESQEFALNQTLLMNAKFVELSLVGNMGVKIHH